MFHGLSIDCDEARYEVSMVGDNAVFKIIQIDEKEKEKYISYIRGTVPDYLLEVNGVNVEVIFDDVGDSHKGDNFWVHPLDGLFFLNYGDLFLCVLNGFLGEENVHSAVLHLVNGVCGMEKKLDNLIADHFRRDKRKPFSDKALQAIGGDYQRSKAALTLALVVGTALFGEQKEKMKSAFLELLCAGASEDGTISAKQFEKSLNTFDAFQTVSLQITYQSLGEEYSFSSLYDLLGFEIRQFAKRNQDIKVCQHCKRYFIPASRRDEKYCDFAFQGFRRCKQVAFARRESSDEVLKTYRRIYKTQNARKQRNGHRPNIAEHFEKWATHARAVFDSCQMGQITLEEMERMISGDEWMRGTF